MPKAWSFILKKHETHSDSSTAILKISCTVIFVKQSNQVLEKTVCYQAEKTFILSVGHK